MEIDVNENDMKRFYRTSNKYLEGLHKRNKQNYVQYSLFIKRHAPDGSSILDLGCGTGYSSLLLSYEKFDVTGVDVSFLFLGEISKRRSANLNLLVADAADLPFRSESFDAVSSFMMIEHIFHVGKTLREMLRVVKKGGYIVIVSPNLLSPIHSLKALWRFLIWGKIKDFRSPFGNDLTQILFFLIRNIFLLLRKMVNERICFSYRVPDISKAIHGDADSVYLSNPIDLRKWFRQNGAEIIRSQWQGKSYFLGPFASTTCVIAKMNS